MLLFFLFFFFCFFFFFFFCFFFFCFFFLLCLRILGALFREKEFLKLATVQTDKAFFVHTKKTVVYVHIS